MAVHNVGIEIEERHNFKHASRKEREPLAVVEISVAAGAFEVKFVVYKIESNAVLLARENSAVLVTPGKMHIYISEICKFVFILFFNILK